GRVLIAPERTPSTTPPRFAWWQLDRSTGDAISVLDTGLNGAQDLPEYAATQQISPLAYEVPPPMPPPISPMAYEVSMPSCVISPMACEVAVPWAQCVEFTEGMMEALNWALAVVGGERRPSARGGADRPRVPRRSRRARAGAARARAARRRRRRPRPSRPRRTTPRARRDLPEWATPRSWRRARTSRSRSRPPTRPSRRRRAAPATLPPT